MAGLTCQSLHSVKQSAPHVLIPPTTTSQGPRTPSVAPQSYSAHRPSRATITSKRSRSHRASCQAPQGTRREVCGKRGGLQATRRRAAMLGLGMVWCASGNGEESRAAPSASEVAAAQAAAVAKAQAEQAAKAKAGADKAKASQARNIKQAEADQARDVAKAEADQAKLKAFLKKLFGF
mmetsp:Transcript_19489/g.23338  ORF Transcript_19489/g.23338 Transcript_19489/m.23338 type:complete len:179 (+) Transcript_19489:213-749(+)